MILNREEATIACEAYTSAIAIEFPGFLVNISVVNILGDTVRILIANVPSTQHAPNGILMNASLYIKGIIHTCSGVATLDNPIFNDRTLKFRKISGANEAEVLKKFHMWMFKNKSAINAIIPHFNRV